MEAAGPALQGDGGTADAGEADALDAHAPRCLHRRRAQDAAEGEDGRARRLAALDSLHRRDGAQEAGVPSPGEGRASPRLQHDCGGQAAHCLHRLPCPHAPNDGLNAERRRLHDLVHLAREVAAHGCLNAYSRGRLHGLPPLL
jgi:hypothetical protein